MAKTIYSIIDTSVSKKMIPCNQCVENIKILLIVIEGISCIEYEKDSNGFLACPVSYACQ